MLSRSSLRRATSIARFRITQPGIGIPERHARHAERVEDLGLGQGVADCGRLLQGGFSVVGGLPEAAAQKARPSQPPLQHGSQVSGSSSGSIWSARSPQRHRLGAAVQAPDGPGLPCQQVGVA